MSTGTTIIEHIQLRGATVEAPVARQRLSYLFSSVGLQPAAMAPSAVLVVRSMSDPLPGRIAQELALDAAPSTEWENAAQARVEEIYRRAARPAAGAVPPSADAILFADQGELLACLALEVDAHAANSWWWKSILRHRFSGQAAGWMAAWAEHPRYVPSALQQLETLGHSARILKRMTPTQAWRMLLGVAQAFGLPEWAFLATERKSGSGSEPDAEAGCSLRFERRFDAAYDDAASRVSPEDEEKSDAHLFEPPLRPPWEAHGVTARISAELGLERCALLGVSLLLRRAPQRALSERFASELHAWLRSASKEQSQPAAIGGSRSDEAAFKIRFHVEANGAQSTTRADSAEECDEDARSKDAKSAIDAAASGSMGDSSSQVSMLDAGSAAALTGSLVLDAASASRTTNLLSDSSANKSAEQTHLPFQNGRRTQLGGVFYLVHLSRQARLLDFNVGLGGWALLELLARCLLDRVWFDVGGDAVWPALAQLDGRDQGTHPGGAFEPLRVYEAPEHWLRNLDSTARSIRFRSGRLELWHSEGFLTWDSQDEPDNLSSTRPFARLSLQQRRLFRSAARVCTPGMTLTPELRRFLHFVLPYARWRLRQTAGNARIEDILLREGMLYISDSHVDLVMGMDQISVPARVAGLDANPGWAPEFGRVINFHFVQRGLGHA